MHEPSGRGSENARTWTRATECILARTAILIFLIIVQLGTEDLWKGVGQRHKSRPEDSITTETTPEAKPEAKDDNTNLTDSKDCIVDSTDNCKPGIGRTDKELGFLDSISDNISDFTDPTVESTGCTDCTKPTDV